MTADGSAPSNQVTGPRIPRLSPLLSGFASKCGVVQLASQFVTKGGIFLHEICETWRTLVTTSNSHIDFTIASYYIIIHKFKEEKPV